MCLYSKQILPRRATKDITVYKEMMKGGTNKYISPCRIYPVQQDEIGKILIANGNKKPHYVIEELGIKGTVCSIIEGGYFHSFVSIPFSLIGIPSSLTEEYLNWHILRCNIKLIGPREHCYKWSYNNDSFIYTGKYRIVECTIPKGSLYWIGIDGDICSDKLIFNKTVSEEEITHMLINQRQQLFERRIIKQTFNINK